MFKNTIEKIRKTSKSASSQYSPWVTFYEEMAKKTALRRLCKYLPMSIEGQQAVTIDEKADIGKQDFSDVIEGEVTDFETKNDDLDDDAKEWLRGSDEPETPKEQSEDLAEKLD